MRKLSLVKVVNNFSEYNSFINDAISWEKKIKVNLKKFCETSYLPGTSHSNSFPKIFQNIGKLTKVIYKKIEKFSEKFLKDLKTILLLTPKTESFKMIKNEKKKEFGILTSKNFVEIGIFQKRELSGKGMKFNREKNCLIFGDFSKLTRIVISFISNSTTDISSEDSLNFLNIQIISEKTPLLFYSNSKFYIYDKKTESCYLREILKSKIHSSIETIQYVGGFDISNCSFINKGVFNVLSTTKYYYGLSNNNVFQTQINSKEYLINLNSLFNLIYVIQVKTDEIRKNCSKILIYSGTKEKIFVYFIKKYNFKGIVKQEVFSEDAFNDKKQFQKCVEKLSTFAEQNSNIIKCFGGVFDYSKKKYFYIYENCETNLLTFLHEYKKDKHEIDSVSDLSLICSIANAIKYFHSNQITGIKPWNVYLLGETIKVDFDDCEKGDSLCGFSCPEEFDKSLFSNKYLIDVYVFSVMAYCIVFKVKENQLFLNVREFLKNYKEIIAYIHGNQFKPLLFGIPVRVIEEIKKDWMKKNQIAFEKIRVFMKKTNKHSKITEFVENAYNTQNFGVGSAYDLDMIISELNLLLKKKRKKINAKINMAFTINEFKDYWDKKFLKFFSQIMYFLKLRWGDIITKDYLHISGEKKNDLAKKFLNSIKEYIDSHSEKLFNTCVEELGKFFKLIPVMKNCTRDFLIFLKKGWSTNPLERSFLKEEKEDFSKNFDVIYLELDKIKKNIETTSLLDQRKKIRNRVSSFRLEKTNYIQMIDEMNEKIKEKESKIVEHLNIVKRLENEKETLLNVIKDYNQKILEFKNEKRKFLNEEDLIHEKLKKLE